MKTLLENINTVIASFQKDAEAQVENGNKTAGARARKSSLEIERLLKDFRKQSVAMSK